MTQIFRCCSMLSATAPVYYTTRIFPAVKFAFCRHTENDDDNNKKNNDNDLCGDNNF